MGMLWALENPLTKPGLDPGTLHGESVAEKIPPKKAKLTFWPFGLIRHLRLVVELAWALKKLLTKPGLDPRSLGGEKEKKHFSIFI